MRTHDRGGWTATTAPRSSRWLCWAVSHWTSGNREKTWARSLSAPRWSTSSALSHPMISPVARANPLFTA